ncbi:hypothetical protein IPH92_00160 [Candidatus Kaiserbacteria bacterium]|nr:MAG: hypothetical protein IPH92_00160 [Candidatus Kaiserbacteria bacterium]
MKNKYTIAYIGAIIALPVALLFIVPAVATTNAFDWNGGSTAQSSFAEAEADVFGDADAWTWGTGTDAGAEAETESDASAHASAFGNGAEAEAGANTEDYAWSSTGTDDAGVTSGEAYAWNTGSAYASAHVHTNTCGHDWCDYHDCDDHDECTWGCEEEETHAPTCTLNVLPSSIVEGNSVKLVWDTSYASAVSIAGIGSVVLDGSKDLTPTQSQTYTLTATGEGGTAICAKSVHVTPKEVVYPAPLCTFSINPESITEGGSATFTWDTTNATAVSIDTIGAVTVDGTKVVYPTQTKNYELTATGNGGTVKCTDSVHVTPKVNPPTQVVKCDSFTASKSHIKKGEAVVLAWNTTDAQSVLINEGVGTVALDGNTTVYLFRSTTFTLTARNGAETNTCQVSVGVDAENTTSGTTTTITNVNNNYVATTTITNVNNNSNYNYNSYSGGSSRNNNNNDDDARCDSFTVSDSRVEEGDKVTLRWKTTDADDVDINQGVGDVDDDGSETVTIDEDTTFTLTARGDGDTDTCRVSVKVDEDDDNNDNDKLRCEFSVSDSAIRTGESVILSWINDATDRLVLKDNNGKTLADSKKNSDIDEDVDFLTVKPSKTTKYTLDVYDGNKKETCVLNVEVGKGTVSGISLSQVPYTGFEAGPMLTAIFYGAIALWGLVLAYALVLKKKHSRMLSK